MVLRISTVNVQGKVGNQVRLGTPTDGSFADGLVTLDENGNVVDAIDELNEAALGVDQKEGDTIAVGPPTDGDYSDGQEPITPATSIANSVDLLNVGLKTVNDSVAALLDRVGWTRIVDTTDKAVSPPPTYLDPPNNTILQTVTVTASTFDVIVEAAFPTVEVNSVPATLPLVGNVYRGNVSVTLAADGPVTVESFDPNGQPAATDTIDVALDLPPNITAATFTGGKPGAQTELKQGDTVLLDVTADKAFDQVTLLDDGSHANEAAVIGVATGTTAQVSVTIADRGTTPQALGARLQVRDAVSAALSPAFNTESAGVVEDVNVVTLNNLFPTSVFGTETYPASQGALKGAEAATVVHTASNFDSMAYDNNGTGHLSIVNDTTFEALKTVNRTGGSYNVEGDGGVANLRAVATRAANAAVTTTTAVINIANVAATVTVSEATARVRSGPAPGNDTTITISADQELFNAPSLDPTVGRGTFQGGGFVGGPKTWTRALRVPDSENPANGSAHSWLNLSATNLAGIATTVITGNDTYVIGGFTQRLLTYPPGTANSTESFPLTTEGNLSIGSFSDGNPGVLQPFGTPDTSGAGNFGWWAPNAASGLTTGRMLNTDQVAANAAGLTLSFVEELP